MIRKKLNHRLTALCLALGFTIAMGTASTAATFAADSDMAFSGTAVKLSYEVGSITLSDVQNAQLAVFQAEMSVSAAVKDYNLAVYTYNLAQGVGTSRISL